MVHHFCIMRPIRSLLGLMLLAAAIACFWVAGAHDRHDVTWRPPTPPSARQPYGSRHAKKTVALKVPADEHRPVPNPPQPNSSDEAVRPAWVGQAPHLEPLDIHDESHDGLEVYVATATAGPYSTAAECDRALDAEIDRVVNDFAEKQFQPMPAQPLKLNRDEVQQHLIQGRYRETVNTASFGPMQQEHVRLVFDSQVRAAIEQQWRSMIVAHRLQYAAIGSGAVLLALGAVYSMLRWKPFPSESAIGK